MCPRGTAPKSPWLLSAELPLADRRCAVNGADRVIKWSTALAVLGVAGIAAVVSYEHATALFGRSVLSFTSVSRGHSGCGTFSRREL